MTTDWNEQEEAGTQVPRQDGVSGSTLATAVGRKALMRPWGSANTNTDQQVCVESGRQGRCPLSLHRGFTSGCAPPTSLPTAYVFRPLTDVGAGQLLGDDLHVWLEGLPRAASEDGSEDQEARGGGRLLQHGHEQLQKHFWADEHPDQLRGSGALREKAKSWRAAHRAALGTPAPACQLPASHTQPCVKVCPACRQQQVPTALGASARGWFPGGPLSAASDLSPL